MELEQHGRIDRSTFQVHHWWLETQYCIIIMNIATHPDSGNCLCLRKWWPAARQCTAVRNCRLEYSRFAGCHGRRRRRQLPTAAGAVPAGAGAQPRGLGEQLQRLGEQLRELGEQLRERGGKQPGQAAFRRAPQGPGWACPGLGGQGAVLQERGRGQGRRALHTAARSARKVATFHNRLCLLKLCSCFTIVYQYCNANFIIAVVNKMCSATCCGIGQPSFQIPYIATIRMARGWSQSD